MYKYEDVKVEWADNTVRFDYVDRSVFSEDIEIPEHWHEEIEINYTMTGEVKEYIIDGETEYVHGGEFIVVNPFQVHGVHNVSRERRNLLLLVSQRFIQKFIPRLSDTRFILKPSIFMSSDQQRAVAKMADLMISIFEVTKADHEYRDDEFIGLTVQLLALLGSNFGIKNDSKMTNNLAETIAYVQKNYKEELTLVGLANRVHLSAAYFDRFFKEQTGYSVMQYVGKIRSMHAYQLLAVDQKSVAYTATMVGFSSTQALNRSLKKNFRLTATALKKQKTT